MTWISQFQGRVLSTGDFLATWAVELAVHHLDLWSGPAPAPAPAALRLGRQTVEALLGEETPAGWDDETVLLLGSGRLAPGERHRHLAGRLPVLG